MTLKTLKGIDDAVWRRIKAHAAMHNITISDFITMMTNEHINKHKEKTGWDIVMSGERTLTGEEANNLIKTSKEMRKSLSLR